jgi:hypothetical protein
VVVPLIGTFGVRHLQARRIAAKKPPLGFLNFALYAGGAEGVGYDISEGLSKSAGVFCKEGWSVTL